jgi:hypothetical protein
MRVGILGSGLRIAGLGLLEDGLEMWTTTLSRKRPGIPASAI